MKRQTRARWLPVIGLCPALVFAAGEIEERRTMAGDGTVSVYNVAGDIMINTWRRDEVFLKAVLGNEQELKVTETSQGIRFEVVDPDDDSHDEADLELQVPVGASIVAEGVSSDITITGSRGETISAESVSGDLAVQAEISRADLTSVSGDIEFEGSAKRTMAEAVSGDIELVGISGEVTISTVSGDAVLEAGDIRRGQFETVSGTLELSLSVAQGGKVTVESMSGDVLLKLPAGQQAEFGLQTFSGDIESSWGSVEYEKFGPGSRLRHVEGDRGTLIQVESFSGDIHIGHK